MLFLEYGVDAHDKMIHISQVTSGATSLVCPYCEGALIARKGTIKAHHFAHAGDTCREAARDMQALTLPFWDRFDVHISSKAWDALQRFHEGGASSRDYQRLLNHNPALIKERFSSYGDRYELTHEGGVPFGDTTLEKFSEVQRSYIYKQHKTLQDTVQLAYFGKRSPRGTRTVSPAPEQVQAALTDLRIYRAYVQRIHSLALYLLRIDHTSGTLYKIGVTSRHINERIEEIERALHPHIDVKNIDPLRVLHNRGAVERYALHRYRDHAVTVGTFTEFFQFDAGNARGGIGWVKGDFTRLGDFTPASIDPNSEDMRGMYVYSFTPPDTPEDRMTSLTVFGLISRMLAGAPPLIEQVIAAHDAQQREAEQQERHRQATIDGMQRAAKQGVRIGRPPGTTESEHEFLDKYPVVIDCLREGLSLRQTVERAGVSKNTVIKVKRILNG